MGQMRFLAPQRERLPADAVERAYMAGAEGIPWPSDNSLSGDEIIVERAVHESGAFHVPWNVEGSGELVLSTTSLMERRRPYHLPVELARGTLNRVRNQLSLWQSAGLHASEDFTTRMHTATDALSRAATSQSDALGAADEAEHAIVAAVAASELLGRDYTRQLLAARLREAPKLPTLLGIGLGPTVPAEGEEKLLLSAFNSAIVPFTWKQIEINEGERDWTLVDQQIQWARNSELKICGGPLLRLDASSLPDWLYLWEDDFENVQASMLQFVRAAVQRYRSVVRIWHCISGFNVSSAISLTEEQRLRLAVGTLDAIRRVDRNAPVVVSFAQPWAEYMRTEGFDLSPLHFADALVRADLGVTGIGLEFQLGYWPGGTLPRDLLEISRKIDQWSVLGLPLLVYLTIPSGVDDDPGARHPGKPLAHGTLGKPTPERQNLLVRRVLPLLVSKQSVFAVFWNQWSDAQPHLFSHGGLIDAGQHPKPALQTFTTLRQAHLN